jgi:hypothetical protein
MATPGQLVEEMAASLGMPVATVTQYDRQLAEAGLRSKGGRGTSAATVTQRDAANLLIAIGASPFAGPTVKEAVRTCKAYGSLRAASQNHNFGQLGLPSLGSLPAGHSLRDGLTVLIEGAGRGETPHASNREDPQMDDLRFSIQFNGPHPSAKIVVATGSVRSGKMEELMYTQEGPTKQKRQPAYGGLHQTRFVSFNTIRALGLLVSGG